MDITLKEYKEHLKNPNKKVINDNIDEYTSDQDFEEYFGKSISKHIITYPELKNFRYITNLLKYDGDFKIILFLQTKTPNMSGHWVLIFRRGNTIIWGDSYGKPPLYSLTYSKGNNDVLDQPPEYLNNLLLNQDKFKVVYNTYPFQDENDRDSAICGRSIILMLVMFKYHKYDLGQYINWFIKQKKKYPHLSNDELITHLIPLDENEINNIN